MKKIAILIILSNLLIGCTTYEFTEKITFCDGRPPRLIRYQSIERSYIDSYKEAVPIYRGLYNVCEVELISEIEIK